MATLGEFGTSDEMVSHICTQLAKEFAGTFSPETIKRFVSESFDSFEAAADDEIGSPAAVRGGVGSGSNSAPRGQAGGI